MKTPFPLLRDYGLLLLWLVIIFTWSTHTGSAAHTNSWVDALLRGCFPHWYAHLPWVELDAIHFYLRKTAHVTEYAVLGFLAVRALCHGRWSWRTVLLIAWGGASCYAATDEFHQIFVAGRTPKVTDVLLDSAGAALGIALTALWRFRRTRPRTQE